MRTNTLSRLILCAVLGPPLAASATATEAQAAYGFADAQYVTTSRAPAVLDYVVCLEAIASSKPRSMNRGDAIQSAAAGCREQARALGDGPSQPSAEDLIQSILECGFRPSDESPDAGCGSRSERGTPPRAPQFRDFPADVYSGPVRAPNLDSHPAARRYETRLESAAKGRVNFAGEFLVTTWGCGTGCLMGAVIAARTGEVTFLPGTVCCWSEVSHDVNPIDFRADSSLLVFAGLLDEEGAMARHFYELRDGRFRLISTLPLVADPAPVVARPSNSQPADRALVCYYTSAGTQHDADSCAVGMDLSTEGSTQLGQRCEVSAQATCAVGNAGQCRSGSGPYGQYQVLDSRVDGCPPEFYRGRGN